MNFKEGDVLMYIGSPTKDFYNVTFWINGAQCVVKEQDGNFYRVTDRGEEYYVQVTNSNFILDDSANPRMSRTQCWVNSQLLVPTEYNCDDGIPFPIIPSPATWWYMPNFSAVYNINNFKPIKKMFEKKVSVEEYNRVVEQNEQLRKEKREWDIKQADTQRKHEQQLEDANRSASRTEQVFAQNQNLLTKQHEFDLAHFESKKVKELETKIVSLEKTVEVQKMEIKKYEEIVDLGSEVIDIKKLVHDLIQKLPSVDLKNLSITTHSK